MYVEVEIELHSFLTQALRGGASCLPHAPLSVTTMTETPVPTE